VLLIKVPHSLLQLAPSNLFHSVTSFQYCIVVVL
jgi:hypothetical protein